MKYWYEELRTAPISSIPHRKPWFHSTMHMYVPVHGVFLLAAGVACFLSAWQDCDDGCCCAFLEAGQLADPAGKRLY